MFERTRKGDMMEKANLLLLVVCALSAPTVHAKSLDAKAGREFVDVFDKSNDTEIEIPDLWLDGGGEKALAGHVGFDEENYVTMEESDPLDRDDDDIVIISVPSWDHMEVNTSSEAATMIREMRDAYGPSTSDEVGSSRDVTLACRQNINFGLELRTEADPFVYEPANRRCYSQMQVLPGTVVKIRPQAYQRSAHLILYYRTATSRFRHFYRIPRTPGATYTIRGLTFMYYLAIQATGNVRAGSVVVDIFSEGGSSSTTTTPISTATTTPISTATTTPIATATTTPIATATMTPIATTTTTPIATATTTPVATTTTAPPTSFCSSCGVSQRSGRIVGGTNAHIGEFPWMTALIRRIASGRFAQFCGGSLITPNQVLTAAHCLDNGISVSVLFVLVGDYNLSVRDGEQFIQARRYTLHENFNRPSRSNNDVAIIDLVSSVSGLNVVCLPSPSVSLTTGSAVTISGWGRTSSNTSPSILQRDVIILQDHLTCRRLFGSAVMAFHLCIGATDGDVCPGDSGGPASLTSTGRHIQIGVTSFRRAGGCELNGGPSGYASVPIHRTWIEQHAPSACFV